MLTVTDPRRMWRAVLLLVLAVCLLAGSWFVRSEPPGSDCAERHRSNEAILNCVAEEGEGRSASPASWLLAITGVGALAGGMFLGARAVDRTMSLHGAAEHLGVPIAEVRKLVDSGKLRPIRETAAGASVRVEDVSRLLQEPSDALRC